jgi:hypothetical protein
MKVRSKRSMSGISTVIGMCTYEYDESNFYHKQKYTIENSNFSRKFEFESREEFINEIMKNELYSNRNKFDVLEFVRSLEAAAQIW